MTWRGRFRKTSKSLFGNWACTSVIVYILSLYENYCESEMQTFLNKAPGKSITLPSDIIVRKGKTWSDVHQWENSFIREWRKIVQLECDYWKNTTFLHSTALHSVASLDGQENAVFFHPWIFTHRFLLHCNYIIMFLLLLFCSVNWIKCKIENARLRSGSFLEMVFKNSCRIQLREFPL